ncbi:MAG: L-threonylcarbamoyladenylate synthase [Thermomicrobiales bacterium]
MNALRQGRAGKCEVIPDDAPDAFATAAEVLRQGGVIGIPTDTVYGLAASLERPDAIARLFALKGRSSEKAIPVLLGDVESMDLLAERIPGSARDLAQSFWPGALTLVVPARPGLPTDVTSPSAAGEQTVAIRVPDSEVARGVIRAAGGLLAVTSANRSNNPPCLSAAEVAALGDAAPDLVLDNGNSPGGVPSTILGFAGEEVVFLRSGAISDREIERALQVSMTRTRKLPGTV